jgi:hypothetical protein
MKLATRSTKSKQMMIRAADGLQVVEGGERVFQMRPADHELLDFSLIDLARRVKACREMLHERERRKTIKPVLSIVRDPG